MKPWPYLPTDELENGNFASFGFLRRYADNGEVLSTCPAVLVSGNAVAFPLWCDFRPDDTALGADGDVYFETMRGISKLNNSTGIMAGFPETQPGMKTLWQVPVDRMFYPGSIAERRQLFENPLSMGDKATIGFAMLQRDVDWGPKPSAASALSLEATPARGLYLHPGRSCPHEFPEGLTEITPGHALPLLLSLDALSLCRYAQVYPHQPLFHPDYLNAAVGAFRVRMENTAEPDAFGGFYWPISDAMVLAVSLSRTDLALVNYLRRGGQIPVRVRPLGFGMTIWPPAPRLFLYNFCRRDIQMTIHGKARGSDRQVSQTLTVAPGRRPRPFETGWSPYEYETIGFAFDNMDRFVTETVVINGQNRKAMIMPNEPYVNYLIDVPC